MHIKPSSLGSIHFVGIGGIGMSGIAEILHNLGYRVQGSDQKENSNFLRLKELGIQTFSSHSPSHVDGASAVVISSAVKGNNVELKEARKRGIPIVKRAEMLGEIMRLRPSIAVAGTHGKTTTTSLVASVLDAANQDPTVINGGIINAYGTNARLGAGEWIVAEADESDGSFTRLPVTIGIITNIEAEHLDHYKGIDEIRDAFQQFIQNIPFYGVGIVCIDHPEVKALLPKLTDRRILTYGFSTDADIRIRNVRAGDLSQCFDVEISESAQKKLNRQKEQPIQIKDIHLPMAGDHNVSNATAALCVGLELRFAEKVLQEAFTDFKGVKRRFTKVGVVNNLTIIDDYAHHPTEIEVVLESAHKSTRGEIIAIVQPHRYTRLHHLMDEFAQALSKADRVIVAPVYVAGEEPIPGVTHEALAEKIRGLTSIPVTTIEGEEDLLPLLTADDVNDAFVIFMGAGDITKWAYRITERLKEQGEIKHEKTCGRH